MLLKYFKSGLGVFWIGCLCAIQLSFAQTNNQENLRTFDPPEIIIIPPYQLENCNEKWPEFLTTKWINYCGAGGSLNSDAGVADGESEDGCIEYRLYTFTVTDYCGNSDTETTRVAREYDMTDPEILDLDDYQLTTCNEAWPEFLTTTWTDNCSEGGDIESDSGVDVESDEEESCIVQNRKYTFTVIDDCGNTATETTIVSREYDITPPEIIEPVYELACNEAWPEYLTTTWTDNCTEGGNIESDAGIDDGESEDGCIQYRLYTFNYVTDNCGNDSEILTTRVSREYDKTDPEILDKDDYQLATCNEAWPEFLATTWTDNCSEGGDIESDAGVADGESEDGCIEYRLYTFTVTDYCGNSDTETTRVAREYDMTDPEILDLDDYQLTTCNEAWPEFLTTTWTDNCSEGGDIESDSGVDVESDEEESCIVQNRKYTFTVIDDCGNTATETTIVSREYDITPPEIIEPVYELACNEAWPEYLTTTWTDNCTEGGNIESDAGIDDGESEDGCIQYRLYTFNYVTDNCGNDSEILTTRVSREYDKTDPEILDKDDYQLATCNEAWPEFLATTWTDNCSEGGDIESDTGIADGESEDGCIEYRLYTFTVTDYCGNSDTETTRVAREYDMTDPEILDLDDYQLTTCNEAWPEFLTTTWTDNCSEGGDIESDSGVDVESDEEESCIVQNRKYTFTVIDDCGNTATETTIVSREYDITPPEIIEPVYELACNEAWPEYLTTTWTDNCTEGGNIESDAGIDDGESEDGCIQYRLYTFNYVTDNCGNDSEILTTRVSREYDKTDPEILDKDDYQLATCNEAWPEFLATTWTDNCSEGGDIESDAGVADGESEDGCIEYRLYTFTVTDYCGNSDTETTRVAREYDMTDPEILDLDDYQLTTCNEAWPEFLTTTWTDNCSEGGDIESDSGVDVESDEEESCIVQNRKYTFTVIDDCGNTATETTIVSREYDITPPEIIEPVYELACNEAWPEYLTTTWTDNCTEGGNIESDAGIDDGESEDGCIQYRLYTFNYVTDNCGNDSEILTTRVSREYDKTDPEILDKDDYQLATCNEAWPEFLATTWTDNCSEGGDIESDAGVADGESEDGCIEYRLYTFTVTDYCGNSDTETTRVAREYDMTDPEILDLDDYQLTTCNEAWPEFLTTTWTDNCSEGGDIESDSGVDVESDEEESCIVQNRKYTFTVIDDCGNTATETTIVSREYDMTEPDIIDVADNQLECNSEWPPFLTTSWTDNCAPGGEIESDGGVDDGVSEDGNIEYKLFTFTVSDNCGNTAEETTRVGRIIGGDSFELSDDNSLFVKCIIEDFEFDLFTLLIGIDSTNDSGEWYMTYGDTTILMVGGVFNPSSLLDEFGNYDEDQLGDYIFTYVLDGICPTEAIIKIHDDCIEFPCEQGEPGTALTPNGDGDNDTFFGGLDEFSRAAGCTMHVRIFNRWGAKIFEDIDYKNDWSGSVQSNAVGSKGTITTGTYFYIITYDDTNSKETRTGYFYVATE